MKRAWNILRSENPLAEGIWRAGFLSGGGLSEPRPEGIHTLGSVYFHEGGFPLRSSGFLQRVPRGQSKNGSPKGKGPSARRRGMCQGWIAPRSGLPHPEPEETSWNLFLKKSEIFAAHRWRRYHDLVRTEKDTGSFPNQTCRFGVVQHRGKIVAKRVHCRHEGAFLDGDRTCGVFGMVVEAEDHVRFRRGERAVPNHRCGASGATEHLFVTELLL